jgi:ABC-type uncharacterized transport system substrate-binding protein
MIVTRAFCASCWLASASVVGGAGAVVAHPHIFIDAGVTLVFDDAGDLGAVRIVWAYDSLFSMLVVEEAGLDPDFDGVLEPGEAEQLSGFDMNWIEGYAGDSYVLAGGVDMAMTRPLEWDAAYEGGRVVSTHLRALEDRVPVGAEPVIVQLYDPTFYTSYEITLPVRLENAPEGCRADVYVPDPEAASEQLLAALQEFAGSDDPFFEDDFPAVGELFAHEVRVTCAP